MNKDRLAADNKRIARNTAYLYFRMFFGLIVSLYTCRVVLEVLGIVDYGINSVVGGFVLMFGFLNNTLSSSMQRFYNYEGVKNEEHGFRQVYNAGLVIHIIIAILFFIFLETFGLWYVNNIMVIPKDRLLAGNIVYQSSVASMILIIMQIPYSGAVMAKERMDYFASVGIFDIVSRLLFVFTLPYIPIDKLISSATFSLLISIMNFLFYFIYCKRKFVEIKIETIKSKLLYRNILSFSGWNLIGSLAFLMKSQGLNMMLNYFFGPIINAARSIAYQINTAVGNFSNNIVVAFRPQLVNSYAEKNYARTRSLMFLETKACFLLIAVLITPFILEIDLILSLWLGDNVPDYTARFAILILIDSLINTLNTPCTQVVHAVGIMKFYQITSSCVNFMLLPISWFLLKIGFDATSVYYAMIVVSITHQTACIMITNKIFYFGIMSYLKDVLFPCIISIILLMVFSCLIVMVMPDSFIRFVIIGLLDLLIASFIGYYIMLNNRERQTVKQVIISKLGRKK